MAYDSWESNRWVFDPEDKEQRSIFVQRIERRLSEVEQRMLLCLLETEKGRDLLEETLYR